MADRPQILLVWHNDQPPARVADWPYLSWSAYTLDRYESVSYGPTPDIALNNVVNRYANDVLGRLRNHNKVAPEFMRRAFSTAPVVNAWRVKDAHLPKGLSPQQLFAIRGAEARVVANGEFERLKREDTMSEETEQKGLVMTSELEQELLALLRRNKEGIVTKPEQVAALAMVVADQVLSTFDEVLSVLKFLEKTLKTSTYDGFAAAWDKHGRKLIQRLERGVTL